MRKFNIPDLSPVILGKKCIIMADAAWAASRCCLAPPESWTHTGCLLVEKQQVPVSQATLSLHIMRSLGGEWALNGHEVTGHLLEPPLAVLTLVSDPSAVTDARPIDALSWQAAVVARFGRGGVSAQHQVKEHTEHQVSADAAQVSVGGRCGSQGIEPGVTFDRGVHS